MSFFMAFVPTNTPVVNFDEVSMAILSLLMLGGIATSIAFYWKVKEMIKVNRIPIKWPNFTFIPTMVAV